MKFSNLFLILFTAMCTACGGSEGLLLESGFKTPPDSIRVGCYWYWIDKTITKQGIIDDLHAMKKAGITRAYIGMTGGGDELIFLSDEWWSLIHTALKTATELNVEIGLFNCPGWSQSGGPWIKPSQSMRYLSAVQRRVKGPMKFSEKLSAQETRYLYRGQEDYPYSSDDFQDVKVLAFPVDAEKDQNLFALTNAHVSYSTNIRRVQKNFYLPTNEEAIISLQLPASFPSQSLVVEIDGKVKTEVELQYKANNGFKTVKTFKIDRTDDGLSRGFLPFAPVVITFNEVVSDEYRLLFNHSGKEGTISGLTLTQTPAVERYPEKTLGKMFNSFAPPWDAFMWDGQTDDTALSINQTNVKDISSCLQADGTVTWDVPEGEWVIMRTGMYPTGIQNSPSPKGASGPEVDKMSGKLTAYHYDAYIGEVLKRIPEADRKSLKYIILDSYEKGGQNFTDNFIEIFEQRYGYNPTPYLPAYFGYTVGSPQLSDRFLWDVRRLVADRIAHEYTSTLREKAHADGMTTWLENYGTWGFSGEFLQYGGQSDEVGGEFWLEENFIGEPEIRCASSCAHTYGQQRVWAESFTGGSQHYTVNPSSIKELGDWAIAEGVNSFILHVYIQQHSDNVYPGVDEWYNTEFNRKNTWFSHMDLFTTYLRRCGYLLQQGVHVADAAYFIGEDAPKMCGIVSPAMPKGHHYDFINAEILQQATVQDGKLTLPHGMQYKVLALPPQETMRPEVLEKIKQLVYDGLYVVGNPPKRSPSLENYPIADQTVAELAVELWGKTPVRQRTFGKGTVFTDIGMDEIFDQLGVVPDFKVGSADSVLFIHRKLKEAEVYFVTNQTGKQIRISPEFRVKGMVPELWDPVTGDIRELSGFEPKEQTTSVMLELEPSGSAFIVFRKSGKPGKVKEDQSLFALNYPKLQLLKEVTSPWKVTFMSDKIKRGPSGEVTFSSLQDWTKNDNPQIKYYSGPATYKTTVENLSIPQGTSRIFLDLGKVGMMAKVKINGTYAGGVWTYPYHVDITPFVKNGNNAIEVEVVNTWGNRIIGDRNLPKDQRRLFIRRGPAADAPLQPSGLLETVKILYQ